MVVYELKLTLNYFSFHCGTYGLFFEADNIGRAANGLVISVLKLNFFDVVQQKLGELILSIVYCPLIIIKKKSFILMYRKVWLL
jgi:hypothetical protein